MSNMVMKRRAAPKTGALNATSAEAPRGGAAREIPVDAIDWSFAIRGVNREHLERLADSASLPAVVVWQFQKGCFRGIDGRHRWHLAKARGERSINAVVRDYPHNGEGMRQFTIDCIRANMQHGLPLTREERNRAIVQLWDRFGRIDAGPGGITLDELAKAFNVTKQRVHQIVANTHVQAVPRARTVTDTFLDAADDRGTGGFSPLGRFSAATKRLSSVLSDGDFMRTMLREHESEVRTSLLAIRGLLDDVLRQG